MNSTIAKYLDQHAEKFVTELQDFLRIPSVSADPAFLPHMTQAATWVEQQFRQLGFKTELVKTPGHPIVYAEWLQAPESPTALVYGHYDVQPPDPLDLWTTPPFEPTIRDGAIYARGATDDKGQVFTHIKSAEAWLKTIGKLPVNLKYVIEGEEEVGSKNLDDFLTARKDALKCDVAVISDTSKYSADVPAITVGLRGIIACEVTVTGPKKDLHSGVFGGSIANPATGLARMIAALHDDAGRIQIPGFYDDVVPLSKEERAEIAALPFEEAEYRQELGVPTVFGETGFTTTERRWARPTCEVNGLFGGYTGVGPKTIVPSKATVKITCRLVPNQNPEKLLHSLEQFLRSRLPTGLTMEFTSFHGAPGFLMDRNSPYLKAAAEAVAEGFGKLPVSIREGGSIPVVTTFKEILGVDTLLLGWGLNTDNLHSPNEHFSLANFQRGIKASAALWECLAK
jgi:acetylornithine deacetylase/succinyl-diaminopimelate desuccinylase-like protein